MSELVISGGNIARVELDTQIATAKSYPRDTTKFIERAVAALTVDQETAESCIYSLKRQGKDQEGKKTVKEITGPSIRFAEVVVQLWGNMHCGVRIVPDSDPKSVTLEGVAWDMQNNVKISKQVKRPTATRDGYAYGPEMRATTENAGASIALRNAILTAIPPTFTKPVYNKVKTFALGDITTKEKLLKQVKIYLKKWNDVGVPNERIFKYLEVKNETEITADLLEEIIGMATRYKEKQITVEEAFVVEQPPEYSAASNMEEKLKKLTPELAKKHAAENFISRK